MASYEEVATDTTTMSDVTIEVGQAFKTISETITITEALSIDMILNLVEKVIVSDSISNAGSSSNQIINETIKVKDALIIAWDFVAAETVNMTATTTMLFEWVKVVSEKIRLSDDAIHQSKATAIAAVTIALADAVESGKGADASETVNLTDSVLDSAIMLAVGADALTVTDTLDKTLVMYPIAGDLAVFNDAVTPNQILNQVLTDGVTFSVMFGLDGDVYQGWVMNIENFAVSEYQDYPFNSFTKIGNKYYGANSNGIYLLDGADDDGTSIDALIATGKITFGDNMSRVEDAFLGLRTDGTVLLKTVVDDDKERWYELTATDWTLRDKRVKLGRGVQSRYWKFKVSNVDGGDFEVDSLTLLPIKLNRRQ